MPALLAPYGGATWHADLGADDRRDVDDRALPGGEHPPAEGTAAAVGAGQVHVEDEGPVFVSEGLGWPDAVDARAVDEHGRLAEEPCRLVGGGVDGLGRAHVERDADMLRSKLGGHLTGHRLTS